MPYTDKEKRKAASRKSYHKHRAEIQAKRTTPEYRLKVNAYQRNYRKKNIDRIRQKQRVDKKKNYHIDIEKSREKKKEYYMENAERERKNRRERNRKIRLEIIALLGGKCSKCGFSDVRALQLDHVHGDGKADRAKHRSNPEIYQRYVLRQIKNGSTAYQLLCANHNLIKSIENREVPVGWNIKYPSKKKEE